MDDTYAVYIMSSPNRSALYTGMTGDLPGRVYAHKQKLVEGFTKKYHCIDLVYYKAGLDRDQALLYEKQIKGWVRAKKVALILMMNPQWKDLSEDIGLAP